MKSHEFHDILGDQYLDVDSRAEERLKWKYISALEKQIKKFETMTIEEFCLWQHQQKFGGEK
jgi:hypothetical protein